MQNGGNSAVDGGEATIDGRGEFVGLADEFAMRAAEVLKSATPPGVFRYPSAEDISKVSHV